MGLKDEDGRELFKWTSLVRIQPDCKPGGGAFVILAPPMSDPVIEVRDVHYSVGGRKIFDGLNITARQGRITAFMGPSGTGKSHLATALGMAACAQGRKVRFFRVTELITLLLEAKEERQLLRLRQQLGKLDLLILDELGYVPASKAGAELLFDVIATAYERNSLIVTTNLPFENWTEVLGSERLTGAALDRLTHRCHILETGNDSFRFKNSSAQEPKKAKEKNKALTANTDPKHT